MKRLLSLLMFVMFVSGGIGYGQGPIFIPAGSSGGAGLIAFSSNMVLSGGTTPVYVPLGGGGLGSTTEADVQDKVQSVATIRNLCVNLSVAPGMGNSVVFKLRDNGVDTLLTVTISNTAVAACDSTHSNAHASGDLLDWSVVPSGTIAAFDPNVMLTADWTGPTTTGSGGGTTNQNIRTIGAHFGGFESGATALSASLTACVPTYFAGTIQAVELIADVSGSVTIDVKTVAHASWNGVASTTSITAAAIPALSSTIKYSDTTLTGWTTTVAAGTDFCFALTSPTTIAGVSISVKVAAN